MATTHRRGGKVTRGGKVHYRKAHKMGYDPAAIVGGAAAIGGIWAIGTFGPWLLVGVGGIAAVLVTGKAARLAWAYHRKWHKPGGARRLLDRVKSKISYERESYRLSGEHLQEVLGPQQPAPETPQQRYERLMASKRPVDFRSGEGLGTPPAEHRIGDRSCQHEGGWVEVDEHSICSTCGADLGVTTDLAEKADAESSDYGSDELERCEYCNMLGGAHTRECDDAWADSNAYLRGRAHEGRATCVSHKVHDINCAGCRNADSRAKASA